jgi:hypothetical protein
MPYRPEPADDERLVVALWGAEKTGKTHTLLTAPQPIYLINTDYGFRELLRRPEFKKLDLWVEDIGEEIGPDMKPGSFEAAQAGVARFHETWTGWIEELKQHPGTLAVDNASFLWELICYVKLEEAKRARFNKQNKVQNLEDLRDQRFDYGPVNHYYNVMMRAIYNTKGSLILTHSAKNKYNERGEETSQLQMQGFRATGAIVQAVCQTYKDKGEFKTLITHSRHRPDLEGTWIPSGYQTLSNVLLAE